MPLNEQEEFELLSLEREKSRGVSKPAKPEYVTGHNAVMGSLSSAADIGATLLRPVDALLNATGITDKTNAERRKQLGEFFQQNADPESLEFKGAGLVTDIAGTAGIGGVLGKLAKVGGAAPKVVAALESGGFNLGGAKALTGGGKLADAALRAGAGAAGGAASAGLVNPDDALKGGIIGAVLPGGVQLAGAAGAGVRNVMRGGAERLMQSALKPTIAQLKSGDAKVAIKTLLDEGISPNIAGVEKMQGIVDDINSQIDTLIQSSGAKIDKQKVLNALVGTNQKFAKQVSPTADLAAIQSVADDFVAHPMATGADIPVQLAQELKKGTYRVLKGKYGEAGSASTEAQKSLARGLKDEIAGAVPDISGLNARESALLKTLGVSERRALMEANKNTMGLAALAGSPGAWAAFMADRSAAFKALAARLANKSANAAPSTVTTLDKLLAKPAVRSLLIQSNQTSQ